jgi:TonB-linked SusC/RagA family outer membrane protein
MIKKYTLGYLSLKNNLFKLFLIMKLTFFLILIATLQLSAKVYSQDAKIKLSSSQNTVSQIIDAIEEQTQFKIFYKTGQFDPQKVVNFNSSELTVASALTSIFQGSGLSYKVMDKLIVLAPAADIKALMQQKITITGRVIDSGNGVSIPGVSVVIKGSKTGSLTDLNGNFKIDVEDKNTTLVFSFIGYVRQEIPLEGRTSLEISLKTEVTNLDEVVIVGYGTQKKASLIGSISSVNSADILRAPMPNISQALVGKLPGLITRQSSGQPGSDDVDMYVRGFGSLNSNSPMMLVDGVERSFNNLDPAEIESVTILKDAAAAAVYGVRGANGVILVTTKRGVESKPVLTYSTSYTLSENTRMPEYLNGEEYVKWYNYADQINGRQPTFSDAVINKVTNGDPSGIYGNTNWVKELIKTTAPTIHHNLTLNGGTNNIKYFVSLGYLNQEGIISGVDYSRYNLRSNLDAKVTKDLSISLNISGNVADSHSPQISNFDANGNSVSTNLMNQIIIAHPYLNAMTPDGKYLASSLLTGNNPLAARDLSGFDNTDNTGLQSSLTIKYDAPFLHGLSFKFIGSYDKNYYHSKSFYTPYTLWQVDPTSNSAALQEINAPYGTSALLSEGYSQATRWTTQQFITYQNTFNNKHAIDALLVAEQSEYTGTSLGAYARNFDLTDIAEFAFAKDNPTKPTGGSTTTRRVGWVGRLNYTYNSRYLAEVSARVDASTNFPENLRYGLFPSGSVGWRISEEDFFKGLKNTISNLKLRASYGILGNDVTNGSYDYMRFVTINGPVANFGNTNVNGIYTTSFPNKNLTWEKSSTANFGFETELWKGLLGAEFDWFYKVTRDILTTVGGTYPPSIGGYYPNTVNSGKVDNRGFELVLTHKNRIGDFAYSIKGSVSWAHNRILSMDQSVNIPEYQSLIGHSMGAKMGLISLGLFQSDNQAKTSPVVNSSARAGDIIYKDINGDGKITYEQDVTIIGRSSMPELNYGFDFSSTWKNFDFSFLIQGAGICDNALMGWYDGIGWDDTQFTRPFYNGGNTPKYLVEGAWTPSNPNGKYPRLDNQWRPNNNWASSMWIINGAYTRLKNVEFGYSLPKSLTKQLGCNAKFYFAATNLVTISAFKYLDPEAPNVNNGYYPQQRTYSLGVTITF